MVVNVADAKAKFSSLLSLVGMHREEVVISKRDKPWQYSYHMKLS